MTIVDERTVDVLDAGYIENPYPVWDRLRAEAPVQKVNGLWWLLGYDVCKQVLHDHTRFSNAFLDPDEVSKAVLPDALDLYEKRRPTARTLIMADPPEHARHRTLVNRAFTGRRVFDRTDRIEAIAHDLIDGFGPDGNVELISAFAVPLPSRVIADILGLPRADAERVKQWSDDSLVALGGLPPAHEQRALAARQIEFDDYVQALIDARRAAPGDDLISGLVQARAENVDPLADDEIRSMVHQIMVAGHETTTNLIGNAIRLLCEHPRQRDSICADPALADPAVEEALRIASPFTGLFRVATEDTSLAGADIAAGELCTIMFGAANHDPAVFAAPHRFDINRDNARDHLAFGEGIHYCLGHQLARAEGRIAIRSLLERLADLRIDADRPPVWMANAVIRGLSSLHLIFEPTGSP